MTNAYGFVNAEIQPTTQMAVLEAAVLTLQLAVKDIDPNQIFVSDTPWPSIDMNDNLFITVAPASAGFDQDVTEGAGAAFVLENSMIQVTVWSQILSDRYERAERALLDPIRGLLKWKQTVLKTFAGQQLYADAPENTQPLLTAYLRPTQAMHPPTKQTEDDYSSFSVVFSAPFNWDLS